MGFGFWGFGLWVWGLGIGVWGFGIWDVEFGVLGLRGWRLGCWDLGGMLGCLRSRGDGVGFRVGVGWIGIGVGWGCRTSRLPIKNPLSGVAPRSA